MWSSTPCTVLAIAALSYCCLAALTLDISRSSVDSKLTRRTLSRRSSIVESLFNNVSTGAYTASVTVGTPPQQITLIIDTGSSDVWLLDVAADLCTSQLLQEELDSGGCVTPYNNKTSSTFKDLLPGEFDIKYASGDYAIGDYITDDFTIAGATIKALEMGLASQATIPFGLIGVGYDINEASDDPEDAISFIYPSIIDSMVNQSLISTKAYSLYLNDLAASTGSIIFGGIDTEKYHGQLFQTPVVAEAYANSTTAAYAEFIVTMTSFSVTGQAGNTSTLTTSVFKEPFLLDSGTTFTYLPYDLATLLYGILGAVDDSDGSGLVYVDCGILQKSPKITLNFGFGNSTAGSTTIKVPIDELVFSLTGILETEYVISNLPFTDPCALGIFWNDEPPFILGDSFLRSAYVLYDLKNNLIGIAQTNFNSTTSNVIELTADATSIPTVTGAAVAATATATSKSAATTTSKSAAVGTAGPLDLTSLLVLGLSSVFAVLGGGWFLA